MPSNRARRTTESHADKLRELLNSSGENLDKNSPSIEYLKAKHKLEIDESSPDLDDLVRLIQTTENVNQQLLFENKYLKDEAAKAKASVLKLIEENTLLHKELKNITVLEILNEFQNNNIGDVTRSDDNNQTENSKNKNDELLQSQLLINELQKKIIALETTKNKPSSGSSNTLNNADSNPICCTKCTEEMEIKIRQIENLKLDLEQLIKTKDFLRVKVEEYESKETDLIIQIKKYVDLVNHLEMEKSRALAEKEQFLNEKLEADKKYEDFLKEFNENMLREKEKIVENVETQIKASTEQTQQLEEKLLKQESLIDRLTREKISLTSELESYKKKCNTFDLDTHQMAEKLRNKYQEILKERDLCSYESKRIRHDFDLYVKESDQEKFCLRNELNSARGRLLETEKDLLESREQCIQLTEQINKLETELLAAKHSKVTVETSRDDNLKELNEKYNKREAQLVMGIEALQARYCTTVKDLEDLVEMQKKLLNKLKSECKTLNEQLEILALKYKNDVGFLKNQYEEQTTRLSKYEDRVKDFEEQNDKHNQLHDKMKKRLKELTLRIEKQENEYSKLKSTETLMRTTNLKLIQEVDELKKKLNLYTMPTNLINEDKKSLLSYREPSNLLSYRNESNFNTARSTIQNSIFSLKSK